MTSFHRLLFRVSSALVMALSGPAHAQQTAANASPPSPDVGTEPMHLQAPPPPAPLDGERDDGPPLLFGHEARMGGYGGFDTTYARMFGRDGALIGFQGALLIDHRLSLGVGWYGFTNPQSGPDSFDGGARHFQTGYGGATVHYSFFFDHSPLYVTVGTLVGGGSIALSRDDSDDDLFSDHDGYRHDLFAIVQPELALNANLTHWMRMGVTAGYRISSGVNRLGFGNADVNGFMLGGQVQFGSF
ncbi:MAG TPA: hypothetical protein VG963_10150 [Polyangiaceae bacterium]|nr:hypothetical protein [Polyangiaceae bacterium]